ncbi:hypothetical protein HYX58_04905 [Candidatus Dependentiae bacterium]|nr:hypothetical protein [Candidatus Dependentiae bacterium]
MHYQIIFSLIMSLAFFHYTTAEQAIIVTHEQGAPLPIITESADAQTVTMEIALAPSPAHKIHVVNTNINTAGIIQELPNVSPAQTLPIARTPDFIDKSIFFTMLGLLAAGTFTGAKFIVDYAPKLLSNLP